MKRVFDFICDECNTVKEDVMIEGDSLEVKIHCPKCKTLMRVSFSGCGKFAMKGKFTAKNSYGLKG